MQVDPLRLAELLDYCIGFAKQMLDGHGEFHPFGAALDSRGQVVAYGAHLGEEYPRGRDVAAVLHDEFADQFARGEVVAAALAANVDIPASYEPAHPDGIRVTIECAGYSRLVYLPYRIETQRRFWGLRGVRRRCQYGEMFSIEAPPTFSRIRGRDSN